MFKDEMVLDKDDRPVGVVREVSKHLFKAITWDPAVAPVQSFGTSWEAREHLLELARKGRKT